jgi:hypothetical protein
MKVIPEPIEGLFEQDGGGTHGTLLTTLRPPSPVPGIAPSQAFRGFFARLASSAMYSGSCWTGA